MSKGRDGGKKTGKKQEKIKKREKTHENSGHYVIASSRPPERRPLERRTLAPKKTDENSGHYVIASSRLPQPLEPRTLMPKTNILVKFTAEGRRVYPHL